MNMKDYLRSVSGKIGDKTASRQITAELEAHILDKADYYTELGFSRSEALSRAVEEMGEPDDAALPLGALHKRKNRLSLIIPSFALEAAVLLIAVFFGQKFSYGSDYYTAVCHSVLIDFLSLCCIAVLLAVLFLAGRHSNRLLALSAGVTVLLISIISFAKAGFSHLQISVFQPALWLPFTLFHKGATGCADSAFAYMYTPEGEKLFYQIGSNVIYYAIFFLALAQNFLIVRREKMLPSRRPQKIHKICLRTVCSALAADFVLLSFFTAVAAANLPSKKADMLSEKREMIELVLSGSEQVNISQLREQGYSEYFSQDPFNEFFVSQLYKSNSNNILLLEEEMIMYSRTDFGAPSPIIGKDVIARKDYEWLKSGEDIEIDDLAEKDLLIKAISVSSSGGETRVIFYAETELGVQPVTAAFENGSMKMLQNNVEG